MKTTRHLYTAEELRNLPLIEEQIAETLEQICSGAYLAAARGHHFIVCLVDEDIICGVKQRLNALGYKVYIMDELKVGGHFPTFRRVGNGLEVRVEWA